MDRTEIEKLNERLRTRAEKAEAERDAALAALAGVVAAWEQIPEDQYHTTHDIAFWLKDYMKPAIDCARAALASNSGGG